MDGGPTCGLRFVSNPQITRTATRLSAVGQAAEFKYFRREGMPKTTNRAIQSSDSQKRSRRLFLRSMAYLGYLGFGTDRLLDASIHGTLVNQSNHTHERNVTPTDYKPQIKKGLDWIAGQQTRMGGWPDTTYEVAISALAATALICSGSTTVQGPYSDSIRLAVDYFINRTRTNGLIGNPTKDNRYTYGHGFAMLFLSQVLGEEEDADRRKTLAIVLKRAVDFSVSAQTRSGGWGYVSAKDGNDFDEGSTTITQVQGLRGCRNAGIEVPGEVIDLAKKYIYDCKNDDGGISYSSTNRGSSRPAITAAALAALYNAGDYDSKHVPEMLEYCEKNLSTISASQYGHWHYTYLYYSQVMYRQGAEQWQGFSQRLYKSIFTKQLPEGQWPTEQNGEIYSTACNLIMVQLERGFLPLYQK